MVGITLVKTVIDEKIEQMRPAAGVFSTTLYIVGKQPVLC